MNSGHYTVIEETLHNAMQDIEEWCGLARRQREEMCASDPICPTEHGLDKSRRVLKQLANACQAVRDAKQEHERAARILAHVPADAAIKAKESAGFGDVIRLQNAVHSMPECPFNYCDQAPPHEACKDRCRHAVS